MAKGGMPQGMKTILGWTLGVAIIAFILLIMAIIFGNLSGNVGFGTNSSAVVNQSMTFSSAGAIPTGCANAVNGNLSNIVIINQTGLEVLSTDNWTIDGVTITPNTTSNYIDQLVNVSYTLKQDVRAKVQTDNIITNYTTSAVNTSSQFPTVGTIIGIAVLLLILIGLLIFAIVKMLGVSGSTISGRASDSSLSFRGSKGNFAGSPRGYS